MNHSEPGDESPNSNRPTFDWSEAAKEADSIIEDLEHAVRRKRRRVGYRIAFSSMALIAICVLWLGVGEERIHNIVEESVTVAILGPQTETLPDGTLVEFAEGAAIELEYTAELRRVHLKNGVAHFQVAKNPHRPFVVVAGEVEVRAVGTAFSVERIESGVEVLVTEGRIAVDLPDELVEQGTSLQDLPIEAGSRVLVESSGSKAEKAIFELSDAQMNSHLDWRIPRFEFDETPLLEVAKLFNEHALTHDNPRLVLEDRSLETVQISGTLRADDLQSLLWIVESEFDVVVETSDGRMVLSLL